RTGDTQKPSAGARATPVLGLLGAFATSWPQRRARVEDEIGDSIPCHSLRRFRGMKQVQVLFEPPFPAGESDLFNAPVASGELRLLGGGEDHRFQGAFRAPIGR